ncbi:hypothetical protein [Borreliella valaisiana]|uniref:hypothetical protein n=2 Tax=Borreliella valaisiana TaxID=62088 RepID=UPI000400B8A3|nr:hypothetical protein [Borreliella valaisiana]
MVNEKLRIPSGAVLVTVNIDKFKWCFKGSDIKKAEEINGGDPKDLVVKDLASSVSKPNKWKSIKECVFRVKKIDSKSKLTSDFDLKEGNIFYYHKDMCEDLSKCFGDADELDVLLFKTYCLGYSYTISSTKATETLKTTCGSISAIGKVPEQTVEFSGYSVKETSTNKEELLESYIEKSHFITRDVSKKISNGQYEIGRRSLPKNFEFTVLFVNQIASQDQRTKFMVGEGQIATYNPSQDLNNQKIDLKCQLTLTKPLVSLSYDYIKDATFFEI